MEPNIQLNVTRSDVAAASRTTQIAAPGFLPSHTATPISRHSDANAVNQVSAISASQPLTRSGSASSAAL